MSAAAVAEPDTSLVLKKERMAVRTDAGIGRRANLGLLNLRTDVGSSDRLRFALPPGGVALYEARLYNDAEITPEKLARMYDEVPATVGLLPQVTFDVVGFACTSGALVIGEERIAARVREALPDVQVTDPVTAARAALGALGAPRIAPLMPSPSALNHSLRTPLLLGTTVPDGKCLSVRV